MPKKKLTIEPLDEAALKKTILELKAIKAEIKQLEADADKLSESILATMPPKDVRQYGLLRCVIVQAFTRRVTWKDETFALARKLYPSPRALRGFLVGLVRRYPKKKNKAGIRLTEVKEEA